MELLAALQFLTALPIKRSFTIGQVGRSTAFFPVVGIIIGLILVGLNYLLHLILPSSVVNALLVAAMAGISGGLHLDGLADTMDGMAGHRTPDQRLEIMRDSRIGGFGALGIALFLILEYVSLNSLPPVWVPYTLVLASTVSRWAMVNSIFAYPYARPAGLGKAFKDAVNWQQVAMATVVTIILAMALFRVAGLVILIGIWGIVTLLAYYFKRQINGLTGDTYGAINEVTTVSVFLLVSMMVYKHWLIG